MYALGHGKFETLKHNSTSANLILVGITYTNHKGMHRGLASADRLSAICTSRTKMSAIRTRRDNTTLLVTKGDNGHFRTLRAITYKKILNKSNAISNL